MSAQCFIMNINNVIEPSGNENKDFKPSVCQEKVMSYEEKSVGSTNFFKCEACPYMALAEDDIKFHLFTEHPHLAKTNGLADNIHIPCPGCSSIFDAEDTLRTHLRNHHKMGIKDVKKMIRSLVQIALKNAKLKKEIRANDTPPTTQDTTELKIPQIIEIPKFNSTSEQLPKGVAFISVDELNKMSTPNFEKVDPKEVIQEASINIVYAHDVSTQYVNVSSSSTSNTACNVIQVSSVTPDLISSILPRKPSQPQDTDINHASPTKSESRLLPYIHNYKDRKHVEAIEKKGILCSVNNCHVRLRDPSNLSYHRKCHHNGKLQCPECAKICPTVDVLHTHLWKIHAIDLELPSCEVCDYKTFRRHRLLNIHMKCHSDFKGYSCSVCAKTFKNANQLSKHRVIHKKDTVQAQCHICERMFNNDRRLRAHIAAVHDKLKPFKCCHCDYTAARKEELKLHMRSHTGDKPYACDKCNYRSADHNSMRRHKKLHSKEGVYKCKHCEYTAIQSTTFTSHMISKHPNITSNDIHRCPYCSFKSVSKEKYVVHLTTHRDKEGIKLLVEMTKSVKTNKSSWTIPSETSKKCNDIPSTCNDEDNIVTTRAVNSIINSIPIEVYDCDSLPETLTQEYSKNFCSDSTGDIQPSDYDNQVDIGADYSTSDTNSDCLMSNSTIPNLHFLSPPVVSIEQNLIQNSEVNSLPPIHSPISTSNNIMCNFPIRLPLAPPAPRNNITLIPPDKISLPMSTVNGPIIKPMQILPVLSSHSPIPTEIEGVPRKKPKISVKSNLILKGPDQVNMFHSQQQMAFKRLEDNERFGLPSPVVTFNNLIMQLQPEPTLSESPNNMMTYPQENLGDNTPTPLDNGINEDPQIFPFNQQMNVNSMMPQNQKIQSNDPSYIKVEATIKQNTQSPSLEKMCNANIMNSNQAISRDYKASPPLEDIHKNMNEIKNEVKSDAFYNMPLNNRMSSNPPALDQYLIDNIIPEPYTSHIDLSSVVLPEADQQNDVIEIDDNSDDNKLPRFDMNFSLESLYFNHNDFHFLENDVTNVASEAVNEMSRMVTEVPIINQKECLEIVPVEIDHDCTTLTHSKRDPIMNTSGKQTVNKINVKNIELMKN